MTNTVSDWHVGLYVAAVLIPLAAFAIEAIFARQLKRLNAYIATGAIGLSCFLSLVGFAEYFRLANWNTPAAVHAAGEGEAAEAEEAEASHHGPPLTWKGEVTWVSLGAVDQVGFYRPPLTVRLGIAIDNLAVIMFLMVTFIAHADPHLLDGLHARRPAVSAVLHVSVAVLLLDARPGRLVERLHDLHLLGAGRRLLVPADRLLVRGEGQLRRGQQGVHRQPCRRRRDARRPGLALDAAWARSTSSEINEGLRKPPGA